MSDNRKYYYLKLKENCFDEDAIVLLESMQDGVLYSNILLKLYLKLLKTAGNAGFAAAKSLAKGRGGHLSTRVRDKERERQKKRARES